MLGQQGGFWANPVNVRPRAVRPFHGRAAVVPPQLAARLQPHAVRHEVVDQHTAGDAPAQLALDVLLHVERPRHPALRGRARPEVTTRGQGWPKLWANFRALIGIFSQSVGL